MGLIARAKDLWGPWWPLPGGFFAAYASVMYLVGDLRPEHVVIAILVAVLAYTGPRTKRFLADMAPYFVVAVGYDLVRYARRAVVTANRVIGCELRTADRVLFPAGHGISAQEWLVAHASPVLDLLFSLPYAVFAYVAFIYAGYLYFVDRPRMRHYLWSFAVANYVSFALWLLVPAAPPWYVRAHGCVIDLSVAPSPAGLVRVDALLGTSYFATFYSRAASVFGAMPSMHNAYPLLGLLTAWRRVTWQTKPIHIIYFLLMFLASLYLDHHWIVDAVAGWIIAVVAVIVSPRLITLFNAERAATTAVQPASAE